MSTPDPQGPVVTIIIIARPTGVEVEAQLPPMQTPEEATTLIRTILTSVLKQDMRGAAIYQIPTHTTTTQ
jgi:hypothetical protein